MANTCSAEQAKLLAEIRQIQFVCVDLMLYLDTHPNDERATMDFSSYSQQLMMLVREYETTYHTLVNSGMGYTGDVYNWAQVPWPWEV